MFRLLRVSGDSMAPTAAHGTLVLALPWPRRWLRRNQLVIAQVDAEALIVKRIETLDGHHITLSSDNRATQSPYCGVPMHRERIVARAIPLSLAAAD